MWRVTALALGTALLSGGSLAWRAATIRPPQPQSFARPAPRRDLPRPRDFVTDPVVAPAEADRGPARIISMAPQTTELVCALGLADRLVGRSDYCDYPAAIRQIPSVGALLDPNLERIVELRPDLLLISGRSMMLRERFERLGLPYVSLPDSSLADIYDAIELLAETVERPETGRLLVEGIKSDIARLTATAPARSHRRVLIVTDQLLTAAFPPFVAGPGSYLDELLALTGQTNAVRALGRPFGQASAELIVASDPEFIIEVRPTTHATTRDYERGVRAWQEFGPISAARSGRFAILADPAHFVPGPRVAFTLRALLEALGD